MRKSAPLSGEESLMSYDCEISAEYTDRLDIDVNVRVPVHTLCPCSKELSKVSAHNQRGIVSLTAGITKFIWIEDLIEIAEKSASSPLYALLKREDEKYLTEYAYDNPRFVEDVVREAAQRLKKLPGLRFFSVEAENMESIHNHSAFAVVEKVYDSR
jgi:GTP cyclohydrolase I